MLEKQECYIDYLEQVKNTLNDTSIKFDGEIEQKVKDVELIVPVVGGFSAGKSTMINQFLGENILGVGLTPETALATELRYSQENYFEAIDKNGNISRYEIAQSEEIKQKAEQYQFLRLHLNNQNLKEIEPLVLVDMPGFDAPIEHHNQAILTYLSRGVYFIVLISAEDGTIHKSILREISNIMDSGKGFSFCLSKTNLRSVGDIEMIQSEIRSQLKDYFDYEENIVLLHKESANVFKKILLEVDPNLLIQRLFLKDLKTQNKEIIAEINMRISSLKMDAEEIKEAVEALKEGLEKLSRDKDKKIQQIQQKYTSQNLDGIVSRVYSELLHQKNSLAPLMIKNQSAFNGEINSVIRQVLVSEIQGRVISINQGIIEDIRVDLKGLSEIKLDTQWIDVLADKMKGMFNGLPDNTFSKEDGSLKTILPNAIPLVTKYLPRIGAIPATIINPILGIAVALLPELIDMFRSKSRECEMKEKAIEYYESTILPSIKASVRNSLKEVFSQYAQDSMAVIYQEFENQIKVKQKEVEKTQQEKQKHQDEIEKNIQELSEKRDQTQALAEKFLYQGEK